MGFKIFTEAVRQNFIIMEAVGALYITDVDPDIKEELKSM